MSKLDLGAFSVSLAVRDLDVSSEFYQKLGFEVTGQGQGYLIMVNGTTVIGLFQGMFEGNILTFNPGLCAKNNSDGALLKAWRIEEFTDVRAIQKHLKSLDLELVSEVNEEENPNGPGSLMLQDPDGNVILVDQFFDCPNTPDQ